MKKIYANTEESKRGLIEYLRQLADLLEESDTQVYEGHGIDMENIIQTNVKDNLVYPDDIPEVVNRRAVVGRRYTIHLETKMKDVKWERMY